MSSPFPLGLLAAAVLALFILSRWLRILKEYERGVIFRLGRVLPAPKGPGLILVLWPIDRMTKVSLQTVVESIPPQDVITRDNVSIKVNAVLYFRIIDPIRAIVNVEKVLYATSQLAQTTLRSVLGMVELDELLAEREKINMRLQEIVDRQADPWGVKVSMVEVKQVDLPIDMQNSIARQAMAEREKRAKIIHAEGEFQAAARLAEAAKVMAAEPMTLQLRYLQTLVEVASERTSFLAFPIPIEFESLFRHGPGRSARVVKEGAPAGMAGGMASARTPDGDGHERANSRDAKDAANAAKDADRQDRA